MDKPILMGAVLYDPKVSVIWDIIREFFEEHGCPLDVVFYTNYELQVSALLQGHIDIAWNSPLAWLDAQRQSGGTCRAIAMRDTDRPVKIPLPGPYLLTRAMFVPEATRRVYPTKEDLAEDVVRVLRDEILELVAEGVAFIQLDEPVLTELVFTQGQTRTFSGAPALSPAGDGPSRGRDESRWQPHTVAPSSALTATPP